MTARRARRARDRPASAVEGRSPPAVVLLIDATGAPLVPPLRDALGRDRLTVIVATGDDVTWLGLRFCPDVDAILTALAGDTNAKVMWSAVGAGEAICEVLARLDESPRFPMTDRDLGFALVRTELLRRGASLTEATAKLSQRLGITGVTVLPASDRWCASQVVLENGRTLPCREWRVREAARPNVRAVRIGGAPAAPAALTAVAHADVVLLGPADPVSGVGAILALHGMADAVRRVPCRFAVAPLRGIGRIGGEPEDVRALARGRLLRALGHEDSPVGLAARYAGLAQTLILDRTERGVASAVRRLGLRPLLADLTNPAAVARAVGRAADVARAGGS